MTPAQLEILLHATNLGDGDFRYISAVLGTALARECDALVAAGFMTGPRMSPQIYPGLGFYYVTAAGISAARAEQARRDKAAGLRAYSVWWVDGYVSPRTIVAKSAAAAKWDVIREIAKIDGRELGKWLAGIRVRLAR